MESLKTLRKNKNYTLEEVAALLNISVSYLSRVENERTKPSDVFLNRLYELYDVGVSENHHREFREFLSPVSVMFENKPISESTKFMYIDLLYTISKLPRDDTYAFKLVEVMNKINEIHFTQTDTKGDD